MKTMKKFEILPHTADLRLKIYGQTKEELFRHALLGMFSSIRPQALGCQEKNDEYICQELPEKRKVVVHSPDLNSLLVDFLSEALYLSDVHNEVYLDAEILRLTDQEIEAILKGVKIQGFEEVEIKAVTYHELNIQKVNDHYETNLVFDI